jgi:hypothetical protein
MASSPGSFTAALCDTTPSIYAVGRRPRNSGTCVNVFIFRVLPQKCCGDCCLCFNQAITYGPGGGGSQCGSFR